ncbi:PucR family transcriptional regulator ligand-binding domain-containing protein [Glutamicibacter sp. TV12E]|uniref:PucR family transcriptional regulator ligand-binding domain-containing protein n=1 Tax=Glutamicibacter sp. TV12E TaxID=3446362 RepID=UPI004034B690
MGHSAPQQSASDATAPGITLRRFLRQLPPEISLVHDAGDRPLRWVEASDMDDPTDYLLDEEMILTSGYPLLGHDQDPEQVRQFIARLAQAKVSAMGFGLEPYFTTIPPTVLDACREHDLPLLEIPPSVPFAAIGIAFAQLVEADNAAQLRGSAEANRALMRCLAHPDPEAQLAAVLSQRLKASVRLLGSEGKVRHEASTAETANLGDRLKSELFEQAASGSSNQQFAMHRSDSQVDLAFPIRATLASSGRAPLLGVLCIGFARTPSAFDHNLITTALGLLDVLARERAASSPASTQLATALLLRSRATLEASDLALLAASLGGGTTQPIRVAVISPLDDSAEQPLALHLTHLQSLLDTRLAMQQDDHFIALTRAKPTQAIFDRLKTSGYVAAFSTPEPADLQLGEKLGDLQAQATGLLPRIREKRQSLDARSIPRSFLSLLPPQAGKQLAEEALAPILELPDARRDLYLEVLQGWLEANGSWDQTSKNIDLHRNSVRRHIATIGEVLDKDLNRADVRQELYLALNFLARS